MFHLNVLILKLIFSERNEKIIRNNTCVPYLKLLYRKNNK